MPGHGLLPSNMKHDAMRIAVPSAPHNIEISGRGRAFSNKATQPIENSKMRKGII